ncbi:TonB-dependent receptor [Bradyrhizobium sp. WBOS7]|uniref:TonB-dependent receptor n=2 Tax=Nitrobacteraceae TaxID=41294 RepID=A0AAE9ND65_9BRAD|nr:TonB-dependent receptor [Bradyrhizobium sp. WBOS2]MDD1572143.1 TonB-dependent receptor [Bradyrhizobium sp. WBOS1]MDD1578219.1 TonB-dependent receptor [Bradyrhizobium sp. WBOS7]MDD1601403.1 TonB-dependent receptor [Bradyrhizobium sp. WBOS16]UUO37054.1 TonB-dependent receptor [Bradyrhizobium sp. WBOS01]UUO43357.1 TonB-dependent receptor [Bradyrhizobium sp. WBOS02]UUO53290.1 TonB-dependent receptor [Bradyrhizobium sp. WBOS07]UUO67293.1 TonB-dependent receptor [Bradyrhizobium betae]
MLLRTVLISKGGSMFSSTFKLSVGLACAVTTASSVIAEAQTASGSSQQSVLPAVTVEAGEPAKPRRAVRQSTARATRQAQSTAVQPAQGRQAGATAPEGTNSDSLKPMGGRLPQPGIPHLAEQSITVVDRAQIEATSPTGLLDVLASVPGVSIARSGGIGGQIYLRGFSSNSFRSPMFIDGDRFRGRNTLQLNYLAPDEIERVEVIRGPGSVVYGSEALTGLVNVVTRSYTGDTSGPFRFTGGGWSTGYGSAANSFNTYDWVKGAGQGFDFIGGFAGRWGGDYQSPLGRVPNSDYQSVGGNIKLGYSPDIGQRLELSLRSYSEVDGRAGGVGGAPGAPYLQVRQDPNQVHSARIAYTGELDGLVKHVETSFYVNYFDTKLSTINNTINAAGITTRTVKSTSHVIGPLVIGGRSLAAIPWLSPWGANKTTLGLDGFREARPGSESTSETITRNGTTGAVISDVFSPYTKQGPDTTQSNVGAFVLHEWKPIQPLTLSAGGRFDWFNTTTETSPLASTIPANVRAVYARNTNVDQTAPTGSLGFVYAVLPNVDLLGNVATSFRQPTNSELFAVTATQLPNPNLKPESGVTYEGGARFHTTHAELKVTAFDTHYENFLQTTAVTLNGVGGYTQSQNVGKAEVTGVELEARWQITPAVNLFTSFAQLRGTNTVTDKPLPFLAPYRGRLGIQYADASGAYSILGVIDWAASKTRIDPAQEYTTSGYAIPKLYATLQLGKLVSPQLGDTKLILGLENIFNTAYVDASTFVNRSYPRSFTNPLVETGRNVSVKLQHTF